VLDRGLSWADIGVSVGPVDTENKVGAVQLSARLRGVSPPVTRRLLITERASLAQLHATLQVAFGWSDEHLYSFQIRGWQFGDPARAIELALAGGVDLPLAAFIFEINETFRYQYNLFVPWEIDCRIESRSLVPIAQPLACLAAREILLTKSSMAQRRIPTGWRAVAQAGRSIRLRNCWMTTWATSDFGPKRATFSPTLDSDNRAGARSISDSRHCRQSTGTQGGFMKMRIQLIIEDEAGGTTTAEIADIERRQSDDLIGLSLEDAKAPSLRDRLRRSSILRLGPCHRDCRPDCRHRSARCASSPSCNEMTFR